MRPIQPDRLVNQTLPSGPLVIPAGKLMPGSVNIVMVPAVVIRPMAE